MVILAINNSDLHRQLRQMASRLQAAESGSDHYNAGFIFRHADSLPNQRDIKRI
jgi:hypothetical protein